jgi:DNA-binding HxlR family transcriptional regulator
MPRGSRKILFSVFDAQPVQVLETLAKFHRSFAESQRKTGLPKATLHRVLKNLVNDKLVEKKGGLYTITSDGDLVLKLLKRLRIRHELKITESGVKRVLEQVRRTERMERLGFSRFEQFEDIQEAVESVKVVEIPP